jgi:hypothetical protein
VNGESFIPYPLYCIGREDLRYEFYFDGNAVGRGYGYNSGNFLSDTAVFSSSGAGYFLWTDVQTFSAANAYQNLHISDAGDAPDAAAHCRIFCPILCVWHQDFGFLPFYGGYSGVCPELCCLFRRNLQGRY